MRIKLGSILDGANRRIHDLPKLPTGPGGEMRPICWAWVLGRCTFPSCRFIGEGGHVKRELMTDAFADTVVTMLTPGVEFCVREMAARGGNAGSPVKKQRMEGGEA